MADSAFQSEADQRRRDSEDGLYKLVELEKQREEQVYKVVDLQKADLNLIQQAAKFRKDDWRDQQEASDRFYRQAKAAESQYQQLLAGRAKYYGGSSGSPPGMQTPINQAPGLASPASPFTGGLSGGAASISDAIKPYMQQAAASFAIPTTALGAFAAALEVGKRAIEAWNQGFTLQGFDRGRAEDAFIRSNPFFQMAGQDTTRNQQKMGRWWSLGINPEAIGVHAEEGYEANTSYRRRGFNLREAAIDREERESTAALTMEKDTRLRDLQRQQTEAEAKMRFGSNDNAAFANIQTTFAGAREQAMTNAGRSFGYSRQAEQADIGRRYATGESLARLDAETNRQRAILEAQGPGNKKNIADLQEKIEGNKIWNKGQEEKRDEALRGHHTEEAFILDQGLHAGKDEQVKNEQQLYQESNKELERQNSLLELNNNLSKQRSDRLVSDSNAISQSIQQERNRKQSLKEQFGLMLPGSKAALVEVAKHQFEGKQLTRQEFEVMKANPEIFKTQLAQMGDKLAGPEWEQLKKFSGMDEQEKHLAQARLTLDNQVKVQINGLDKNLANQILEQLLPSLSKVQEEVVQKFKTEMERAEAQRQANRAGPIGN